MVHRRAATSMRKVLHGAVVALCLSVTGLPSCFAHRDLPNTLEDTAPENLQSTIDDSLTDSSTASSSDLIRHSARIVTDHPHHRGLASSAREGAVCQLLQLQILGSVKCSCRSLTAALFEFECASFQSICDPLKVVCGYPSVLGTVAWSNIFNGLNNNNDDDELPPIDFQGAVCVRNVSLRGQEIVLEPLCVQLPYEDNMSGGSLLLNWINAILGRVTGSDTANDVTEKSKDKDDEDNTTPTVDCVATVGDTQCLSCFKCADDDMQQKTQLYTMNCSNIHSEIVVTCQSLQIPRSIMGGKRRSVPLFVPELDEAKNLEG